MIKQLFTQIWNERRQNGWLVLELLVVFFFLLLITDLIWIKVKNYSMPLSFNTENVYQLKLKLLESIAPNYVDPATITDSPAGPLMALTDRVRLYKDVEAVSISYFAAPYPDGEFWDILKRDTADGGVEMRGKKVMPEYFKVFRMKTVDDKEVTVQSESHRQVMLTADGAQQLFTDAVKAIGSEVYGGDGYRPDGLNPSTAQVIGVLKKYKNQEFEPYKPTYFEILDITMLNEQAMDNIRGAEICVRIKDGSKAHFEANFEAEMGAQLRENNLYVASVVPFTEMRNDKIGPIISQHLQQIMYVTGFVLITVFLGVFGTFWLRTRQRYSEIGLRMALGSSRWNVKMQLITEGICLIMIVALPALLVYVNLMIAEILNVDTLAPTWDRVVIVFSFSLLVLIAMVSCGILWPASQAAAIEPADALHNE